jgi:hypothetical protein
MFEEILAESQGQNPALTALHAPHGGAFLVKKRTP